METFVSIGWIWVMIVATVGVKVAFKKRQLPLICLSVATALLFAGVGLILPAPTLLKALGLKPLIGKLHFMQIGGVIIYAGIYAYSLSILYGLALIIFDCYKHFKKKISKRQLERVEKAQRTWYLISDPLRSHPTPKE